MLKQIIFFVCLILIIGCSGGDSREVALISGETDISIIENDSEDFHTIYPDSIDVEKPPDVTGDDVVSFDQQIDPDELTTPEDMDQVDPIDQESDFEKDQNSDSTIDIGDDQQIDPDQADLDQIIDPDQKKDEDQAVQPDELPPPDQNGWDDSSQITEVNVTAFPQEVEVFVECGDFTYSGIVPFDVELPIGDCEFTFFKDGYESKTVSRQITPETSAVSEILQPLDDVMVTFVSDPSEVSVCIDDQWCNFDAQLTDFTMELPSNSNHFAFAAKQGYYDTQVEFYVGENSIEVLIEMDQIGYEQHCAWLEGNFGYIGGSIPAVEDVTTFVEVYDDHCLVYGFLPPTPEEIGLYGEYSTLFDFFYMDCPSVPDMCKHIHCITDISMQTVNCDFTDDEGQSQDIQWFKLN